MMGPRLGMVAGAVPYVLLVFANIAPSYSTLIPASAGVGFGAGLLWTSQGIYMSRCAIREAAATGESVDLVTSRFNGTFWTMFQFNAAVGLVVSSIVLGKANDGAFALADAVKYMFAGFGAIGCAGIAIMLSLKNAPSLDSSGEGGSSSLADGGLDLEDGSSSKKGAAGAKSQVTLTDTLQLIGSSRAMQLLLPVIFYVGASLGFFGATYPLVYQDPSTGPNKLLPAAMVGYQAATFYATNSAFSFLWGKLVPITGRRPIFLVTLVFAAAFFVLVALYTSGLFTIAHGSGAAYAYVFALAIVFAASDSVLESQLPAIIQSPTFFPVERDRDAANSVFRMLQSLGFCAQYGIGIAMPCKDTQGACTTQALILLGMLVVSLLSLWACDKYVRPIESGGKDQADYAAVGAGDDEE
jgi:MFS family permease